MEKKQALKESIDYITRKTNSKPEIGIVLGTGLGKLLDHVSVESEILYRDIPHFPEATVEFHSGRLVFGTIEGKSVVVMSGRFHLYEGYTPWQVTYGIRVMHALGIHKLFISNAAGAINLNYKKGDLMLLDDHINLQGSSPLAFAGVNHFGLQFADMLEPYSVALNNKMKAIANEHDILLHEGIYAGVLGPQLETRAEYRMLQILKADAVGMSTVPEVIVAKHLNIETIAVSVLTDECDPDNLQPVDINDIIKTAGEAEPKLVTLFKKTIQSL